MAVTELRVSGYRSIRDVTLPLTQINVVLNWLEDLKRLAPRD